MRVCENILKGVYVPPPLIKTYNVVYSVPYMSIIFFDVTNVFYDEFHSRKKVWTICSGHGVVTILKEGVHSIFVRM